jgi:hypothetical protein
MAGDPSGAGIEPCKAKGDGFTDPPHHPRRCYGTLRILVPYVRLSPMTRAALEAEGYHPIYVHTPGPHGYIDALETMWGTGEGFIVVEQDKVPPAGALAEAWACAEDYCCFRCEMTTGGFTDFPSLSTVKFSTSLVRRAPALMQEVRHTAIGSSPPGHYSRLDMAIYTTAMLGYMTKPHWHEQQIHHYHTEEERDHGPTQADEGRLQSLHPS